MSTVQNSKWIVVSKLSELAAGKPKVVEADRFRIALCKVEGDAAVYAIEDICTHDDGPLAEGPLDGAEIECPRHGARFDIKTGAVISMPAVTPVRTFKTRVSGQNVEIEIPE